jgi:hypothetical protein
VQPPTSLAPAVHWPCAQVPGWGDAVQTPLLQVCPVAQLPQSRDPPQPFETLPQLLPSAEQVVGVQVGEHTVHIDLASLTHVESQELLQQYESAAHTFCAQLLQAEVSFAPDEHSLCRQLGAGVPHTLLVHAWLDAQVPHVSVPPQPSEMVPQVFPCAAHVVSVLQTQTLSLQSCPAAQAPQSSVFPHPSAVAPQVAPFCWQVSCVQAIDAGSYSSAELK